MRKIKRMTTISAMKTNMALLRNIITVMGRDTAIYQFIWWILLTA